jgi:hypothetical protein
MHRVHHRARTIRFLLGLSTALVLGLIPIASASALPTKPYFNPVSETFQDTFTVSGSNLKLQTPTRSTSVCNTVTGSGSLTGPKTGHATLTASGCSTLINYCHGKGMGLNEFKTTELEVIPVYAPTAPQVGLEMKPKVGTTFAELESIFGNKCGLTGSIIAHFTTFKGKSLSLEFDGVEGSQTPNHYENEAHESVNSWLETAEGEKESWDAGFKLNLSREIELVH